MKIEFNTDGAAFCGDYTGEPDEYSKRMEIKRILNKIAVDIYNGYDHGSVIDINGNKVGIWEI